MSESPVSAMPPCVRTWKAQEVSASPGTIDVMEANWLVVKASRAAGTRKGDAGRVRKEGGSGRAEKKPNDDVWMSVLVLRGVEEIR